MRSLVVGMGFGQLYKSILLKLNHEVITVDGDISKGADFPTIESAIFSYGRFDTVNICTPNCTHLDIATKLAPFSKIIFVEKPGVKDKTSWQSLINNFPNTRFIMVKNNMWRDNISELQTKAQSAKSIKINWINKDRVPNPGSWFTNKTLAYGGVSRDLMPHLLSLYVALNPNWRTDMLNGYSSMTRWSLEDIANTNYGTVNVDGVYDVDDKCHFSFASKWNLEADWRRITEEKINIEFINQDKSVDIIELGLCPEYAYELMIKDAIGNVDNDNFWNEQLEIDLWIHERIENI
jgi:hypothetical protein